MSNGSKSGSVGKIRLNSFEDLFSAGKQTDASLEKIINVPLTDLHTFKDHLFRVVDDEKMKETTESIRQYGVLVLEIARPRADSGYEIIAGHRRKLGSELVGKAEIPMIIRNYTDDEATIIMVDSNIQREDILLSEKARAYKMKFEAMKYQGKKGGKYTLDDSLLEMVDNKKLEIVQGIDLSFLPLEMQERVQEYLMRHQANVSNS